MVSTAEVTAPGTRSSIHRHIRVTSSVQSLACSPVSVWVSSGFLPYKSESHVLVRCIGHAELLP